ncbi:hypothetical protein L596_012473 [Steinernema carpocapsae]|uniref:Uncharacterized protein n=1 Tax=Steinernema carpocapsae TaxID=34508 RepID=A0A4U5NX66_STECR|nr:hypothetical protein L596_012473 [Steinernema carpocapsae]
MSAANNLCQKVSHHFARSINHVGTAQRLVKFSFFPYPNDARITSFKTSYPKDELDRCTQKTTKNAMFASL